MKSLQFGPYVLNPVSRELRRDGELIGLPGKALDLLAFMASNSRRPLLKSEILAAVWPDSFVEESNLNQNVFLLRKALLPDGDGLIVTLPRKGYQFTAEVSEVDSSAAITLNPGAEIASSRFIYREDVEERILLRRSPALMLLLAGAVIVLAAAGWLGWQRWEDHVGGPPVEVVLTDLEGSTGDPVLDRMLNSVFRIELSQSPYVALVPGATVRRTLTQMMHQANDPVTVDLARDICERTGSQAVLHGMVARAGNAYVLTEDAVNCTDGTNLGYAKQVVAHAEDLPEAIEKLGASVRHSLGESRRTIARFNKPLAPVSTRSLEALKDYSQGSYLGQQGHFPEAIALLKQAVAIDPNFAAAYLDLGGYAANSLDPVASRAWLVKAYEQREYGTEPTRLFIIARYHSEVTGDLYESLRNYQAWISLYPRSPQPWSGLANVYNQLGNAQEEVAAAQHLFKLLPTNAVAYSELADAQIHAGDFAASRATCELAISRNYDTETVRYLLLRIGHLTHDPALIAAQVGWADAHPNSPILFMNMAQYAQDEGRMVEAEKLFERGVEAFNRQGAPAASVRIRQGFAATYAEFGELDVAKKMLGPGPLDPDDFNALLALAEIGEPAKTATLLQQQLKAHPQSTLWNQSYAPLIQGELAMRAGKPLEAIALMGPGRQLNGAGADGFYLRGKAYLQANQLPQAEAEFRSLLAHPGIEATAYQLPMSQLQLARVLAREKKIDAAREAYRTFLDLWAHADTSQPTLMQAKSELADLQAPR